MSFRSPTRIVKADDHLARIKEELERLGCTRAFVVAGKSSWKGLGLEDLQGMIYHGVESEPKVERARDARDRFLESGCDCVLAIGGGSVIDVAKLVGTTEGDVQDYLAKKRDDLKKRVPLIAVPTTAGTGSEVGDVSVITSDEMGRKKSVKHDALFPDTCILDSKLTRSLPREIAIASGLDALSHALESLSSVKADEFTIPLSVQAAGLAIRNIRKACDGDSAAKENMLIASSIAGIAFCNAGNAIAHGISGYLGYRHKIRHGICNAILMPAAVEFNLPSCKDRYGILCKQLGIEVSELSRLLSDLNDDLGVPDLGQYIKPEDLADIARNSFSGSMKNNPRQPTEKDIAGILNSLL